jgi:hypothetical protein
LHADYDCRRVFRRTLPYLFVRGLVRQQIGSRWGMMTGMLVGNFAGIRGFDILRKLKRHPDFGREKA